MQKCDKTGVFQPVSTCSTSIWLCSHVTWLPCGLLLDTCHKFTTQRFFDALIVLTTVNSKKFNQFINTYMLIASAINNFIKLPVFCRFFKSWPSSKSTALTTMSNGVLDINNTRVHSLVLVISLCCIPLTFSLRQFHTSEVVRHIYKQSPCLDFNQWEEASPCPHHAMTSWPPGFSLDVARAACAGRWWYETGH